MSDCKICQGTLKTELELERGVCSECSRAIDEIVLKRLERGPKVLKKGKGRVRA